MGVYQCDTASTFNVSFHHPPALASARDVGTVNTNHHSINLVLRAGAETVEAVEEMGEEEEAGVEENVANGNLEGRDSKNRLPAAQTYGLDRSPSASSVNAGWC